MLKSEYARDNVQRYLTDRGPVTIADLINRAPYLTDDGDPRWIGAAVRHFDETGQLVHVTCDPDHDHDASCTVEWVR
jgi:hypothetical protein